MSFNWNASPFDNKNDVRKHLTFYSVPRGCSDLFNDANRPVLPDELWPAQVSVDQYKQLAEVTVGTGYVLNHNEFWNNFNDIQFIGEGSFGFVWKGVPSSTMLSKLNCSSISGIRSEYLAIKICTY